MPFALFIASVFVLCTLAVWAAHHHPLGLAVWNYKFSLSGDLRKLRVKISLAFSETCLLSLIVPIFLFCLAPICFIFHPQLKLCTMIPILSTFASFSRHPTLVFARCSLVQPYLKHSFAIVSVHLVWCIALVGNSSVWGWPILVFAHLMHRPSLELWGQLPSYFKL